MDPSATSKNGVLDIPQDRVEAIQSSMRSLIYGALSLIPFLGVVFAVKAFGKAIEVWQIRRGLWNPAAGCLRGGLILASFGLLLTFAIVLAVAIQVLRSAGYFG